MSVGTVISVKFPIFKCCFVTNLHKNVTIKSNFSTVNDDLKMLKSVKLPCS